MSHHLHLEESNRNILDYTLNMTHVHSLIFKVPFITHLQVHNIHPVRNRELLLQKDTIASMHHTLCQSLLQESWRKSDVTAIMVTSRQIACGCACVCIRGVQLVAGMPLWHHVPSCPVSLYRLGIYPLLAFHDSCAYQYKMISNTLVFHSCSLPPPKSKVYQQNTGNSPDNMYNKEWCLF